MYSLVSFPLKKNYSIFSVWLILYKLNKRNETKLKTREIEIDKLIREHN